jgi:hypothetical protein
VPKLSNALNHSLFKSVFTTVQDTRPLAQINDTAFPRVAQVGLHMAFWAAEGSFMGTAKLGGAVINGGPGKWLSGCNVESAVGIPSLIGVHIQSTAPVYSCRKQSHRCWEGTEGRLHICSFS